PTTAVGALSIQSISSSLVTGDTASFVLTSASGLDPQFASLAWDFNYDGTTFQPDADAGGELAATTTFDTVGTRTVAVQLTDDNSNTQIITLPVTVAAGPAPAQQLSITNGTESPVADQNVTFSISADTGTVPSFTSVAWDFNYDWATFQSDTSGT